MKTKVIGLTGQTGAGKSTVSDFAKKSGCAVINADKIAREVMTAGSDCLKRLAEVFGSDILREDGSLDRKRLAQKAFSSAEHTDLLNDVTHPAILDRTKKEIAAYGNANDVILFDAPQLYESGGESLCDSVIAVTAPLEVRLNRIMKRDSLTDEEALQRIRAQHDEEYYTARADYLIDGSRPLDDVEKQLDNILKAVRREEL